MTDETKKDVIPPGSVRFDPKNQSQKSSASTDKGVTKVTPQAPTKTVSDFLKTKVKPNNPIQRVIDATERRLLKSDEKKLKSVEVAQAKILKQEKLYNTKLADIERRLKKLETPAPNKKFQFQDLTSAGLGSDISRRGGSGSGSSWIGTAEEVAIGGAATAYGAKKLWGKFRGKKPTTPIEKPVPAEKAPSLKGAASEAESVGEKAAAKELEEGLAKKLGKTAAKRITASLVPKLLARAVPYVGWALLVDDIVAMVRGKDSLSDQALEGIFSGPGPEYDQYGNPTSSGWLPKQVTKPQSSGTVLPDITVTAPPPSGIHASMQAALSAKSGPTESLKPKNQGTDTDISFGGPEANTITIEAKEIIFKGKVTGLPTNVVAQAADTDEAGHAFQSEAGHPFRFEAGHCSDLKSATGREHSGGSRTMLFLFFDLGQGREVTSEEASSFITAEAVPVVNRRDPRATGVPL